MGPYANKCPAKPKEIKGTFKVQKVEEPMLDKRIRSQFDEYVFVSDMKTVDNDSFITYWIKVNGNQRSRNGD